MATVFSRIGGKFRLTAVRPRWGGSGLRFSLRDDAVEKPVEHQRPDADGNPDPPDMGFEQLILPREILPKRRNVLREKGEIVADQGFTPLRSERAWRRWPK